eukprot:scaffold49769_cov54-Phaeocystis_antarctica.AAC.5
MGKVRRRLRNSMTVHVISTQECHGPVPSSFADAAVERSGWSLYSQWLNRLRSPSFPKPQPLPPPPAAAAAARLADALFHSARSTKARSCAPATVGERGCNCR